MSSACPNCSRGVGDTAAIFCMFCGHRLGDGVSSDPHATTDMPTVAYGGLPGDPHGQRNGETPTRVGGYRIIRHLGEGGMGSVFEAEAIETGTRVALKLLSAKLASNPVSVERFKQEGRLASQISHPRCVFVYGAETDGGRPFIVMELMPGTTLKDLVDRIGCLSPPEAIRRTLDVVDGLIEAHRLGVVHRDVKPSNCFLTADDRVKVGDFGLSKSLSQGDDDKQLTSTGAFLGTVLFAAPEQFRGEDVGYDSDVYSVCGTLYFLLTARAPYQHESLTAALAKAISEAPPPIRNYRPDVPLAVDRVVRRGLERDRKRRFATLEELRDALQQLQPEEQQPARTRMLIAAYMIDWLFSVFLVQIPIDLVEYAVGSNKFTNGASFDPFTWLGFLTYFALGEGLGGATTGKWLLGLRLTRIGAVGPPGVGPAALRSAAFLACGLAISVGGTWAWKLPLPGPVLAGVLVIGGLIGLVYRFRRPHTNQGLHDRLTNLHVVQVPRPPHRMRLIGRSPNPLDQLPPPAEPLPATVGGFTVRGKLSGLPDRGLVWVADDKSLGRRILLRLRPHAASDGGFDHPVRPARLRQLGNGDIDWQNEPWSWIAFAAPAGAPLADTVSPKDPLSWPDARLLLEQLMDELKASNADGTTPSRLGVDQLWTEPGGRLTLLDFPIPMPGEPVPAAADEFDLLRQMTALTLEGRPRTQGGRVKAPLPPHASAIATRLFTDGYTDLAAMQQDVADSHAYPPRVTRATRAAQIGLTALLAGPLLLAMLLSSFAFNFGSAAVAHDHCLRFAALTAGLEAPELLAKWRTQPAMAEFLDDAALPATKANIVALSARLAEEKEAEYRHLNSPERHLFERMRGLADPPLKRAEEMSSQLVASSIQYAVGRSDGRFTPGPRRARWFRDLAIEYAVMLGIFALFALLFRGGLSYTLSGIALVRRDGRPAGRFRCFLRELLLWMPLVLVLLMLLDVQVVWPDWFFARLALIVAAVAVLLAYAAIGIRCPERSPLDRLTGTFRVPV